MEIHVNTNTAAYKKRHEPRPGDQRYKWPEPEPRPEPVKLKAGDLVYHNVYGSGIISSLYNAYLTDGTFSSRANVYFTGYSRPSCIPLKELSKLDGD